MTLVGALQIQERSRQLCLWLAARRDQSRIWTQPKLLRIRKFDQIYTVYGKK